jgi:glycosyltransferase involved in cell wall biosynthesis
MTRVLFVDHTAQLGGAELCLLDLSRLCRASCRVLLLSDGPLVEHLRRSGVEVHVCVHVCRAGAGWVREVRKRADPVALARHLPALWADARRVAAEAREFDAIWASNHKAFAVSALAGMLVGRPVIYHLHDLLDGQHFGLANRWAMVLLANACAARVVVNSRATARAFVAAGGRRALLRILYNGFEFGSTPPPAVGGDRLLVGMFSRLAPWKGQHVLLDALALDERFSALIVGDALFDADRDYARELERRVRALGLKGRVQLLGFREDARALMAACDVLVHCSVLDEPFGRVVVEGMAAGRPVVAAATGGVPELVEDGRTGLLVPPGDAAALAAALRRLIEDRVLARRLGEEGRRSALHRFNLEQTSMHFACVLSETCGV